MSDDNARSNLKRRSFVKWAGAAGAGLASAGTASAGGGKRSVKTHIEFHNKCRRVTVSSNKKVTIKAYTKREHRWGGKVIEKKAYNFDWTVGKYNYFTKVEVYYKGELCDRKYCDKRKREKPDCDIDFHDNCRRVTVKCDKEVTVKAYTKREHKWGGKVIKKKTDDFDWTVSKYNYFTKVKVYYKGELIAEKKCERKRKKPDCDIDFHDNCRRVTVKCDKEVTVKAYTKRRNRWGGKVIEKKTKNFDCTVRWYNYFTKVKVYYKGKLIAEKKCDRKRRRRKHRHGHRHGKHHHHRHRHGKKKHYGHGKKKKYDDDDGGVVKTGDVTVKWN